MQKLLLSLLACIFYHTPIVSFPENLTPEILQQWAQALTLQEQTLAQWDETLRANQNELDTLREELEKWDDELRAKAENLRQKESLLAQIQTSLQIIANNQ